MYIFKLPCNVLFIMWSEVGVNKRAKTKKAPNQVMAIQHTRFSRVTYIFHIFTSEYVENTSVLVYGKTPIAI